MSKLKTIHLRLFKSKDGTGEILTRADGTFANENQTVKLEYNTREWRNYLAHLKSNGFIKVEILGFINSFENGKFDYSEVPESVHLEVKKAMTIAEKELTPEQKEIAELKNQIAEIMKSKVNDEKKTRTTATPELKEARLKYEKTFGKKGDAKWSIEQLNEKIKAKTKS